MTKSNALLPSQVELRWRALFNTTPMSERVVGDFLSFILRYLPPPTQPELKSALQMYFVDQRSQPHDNNAALKNIRDVWAGISYQLDPEHERRVATFYPFFYALVTISRSAKTEEDAREARLLFQGIPRGNSDNMTPSVFYDDVLAVRDVVTDLLEQEHNFLKRSQSDNLLSALQTAQSTSFRTHQKLRTDKIERFAAIASGTRHLGEAQRRSPENKQESSQEISQRGVFDRIGKPVHDASQANKRSSPKADDENRENTQTISVNGERYRESTSRSVEARDSDPSPTTLKRTSADQLTPSDDQARLRRRSRIAPQSALASNGDIHRLPTGKVLTALDQALDYSNTALAFCLLLVTTGLKPSRLASMPKYTSDPRGNDVCFEPEQGLLKYQLEPGSPSSSQDGSNRLVVLALPTTIKEAISYVGESQPFSGLGDELNKLWGRHYGRGVPVTVNRLSATATLWLRPLARDAVAEHFLTGGRHAGLTTQSAYRAISTVEIQQLYNSGLQQVAAVAGMTATTSWQLKEWLGSIKSETGNIAPPKTLGSAKAFASDAYRRIFRSLKHAISEADEEVRLSAGKDTKESLPVLCQAFNWRSTYLYLGLLLATGMRPVSTNTILTPLSAWAWFLADKNSGYYTERRVVPIVKRLYNELDRYQEMRSRISKSAQDAGFQIDSRSMEKSEFVPSFLHYRQKTLYIDRMTHRRFAFQLSHIRRDRFGLEPNSTRHTFATILRNQLDEASLEALMGHSRYNADRTAPHSTSALPLQTGIRTLLDSFLKECGFEALNWETINHVC